MVPRFKNLATRGFAIALTKLSSCLVASSATMYRVHFTTAPEKKSIAWPWMLHQKTRRLP
jgi:hypothetical protein